MSFYHPQGFRDKSLSVWQASCVLRNYELRTGNVISRDDLETGVLAYQFTEEDYKIDESVCFYLYLPGSLLLIVLNLSNFSVQINFPLFVFFALVFRYV